MPAIEPSPQNLVREFHDTFGLTANSEPTRLTTRDRKLRLELLKEEYREVVEAILDSSADDRDYFANVAKELADLVYVTVGTAVSMGLPHDAVFSEVHRSNMTKVHPDGTVQRRDDGKILKPETYEKAQIKPLIGLTRRRKAS